MLKKTLTYTDFNGDEVSEDFFFHLSKAELVELEVSHKDGLSESLKRILEAEDGAGIVAEFKNIILTAYGKRSDDGKRFIKNQQLRDEFESTEAYSTLFMELVLDAGKAAEFVNGIVPTGLDEAVTKITGAELAVVPEVPEVPEVETITMEEFKNLPLKDMEKTANRALRGEVKVLGKGDESFVSIIKEKMKEQEPQ